MSEPGPRIPAAAPPDEHALRTTPAAAPRAAAGVSARAIAVALLLLLALLPIAFMVEQATDVSRGFSERVPPIAALGLALLLTAFNQTLSRRSRWRGMSRQEVLVVYILLTIGGPLVSLGVMLWFLSCSLGQQYYVRTMPQWQGAFFKYIPPWFSPSDWPAVEGFFQGGSSVPWHEWWTPLAAWGLFFTALVVASFCPFLLVQRQWIIHERLTFPIAQVPLDTVRDAGDGTARLPAARMFWIGFAVCSVLYVQQRLPEVYPSLPHLEIWGFQLATAATTGPLVGLGDFWVILFPWTIALAYLMPKELSFSMWFFWFVRVACTIGAIAAGATPRKPEEWGDSSFPAPYYQGGGAIVALGLLALWAGRHQIVHSLRAAFAGSRDSQDTLPYRWVMLALFASLGYLTLFCCSAGMRLGTALILIGLILAIHLVWGRLRAENGMSFIAIPFSVDDFMFRTFGTGMYRPAELITILATRWSYSPGWGESCEVITGASSDALKISDSARIRQRPLVLAMLGVLVFALALGVFIEASGTYHYGFLHTSPAPGWLESMVRTSGTQIYDAVNSPAKRDYSGIAALAVGMAVTFGLAQLRLRFWWWPLHPVGYLAANVWGSHWWWTPLFVGWLFKSLTIRYGGLRLYQKMVPAAIGVIVGDSTCQMIWGVALWLALRLR